MEPAVELSWVDGQWVLAEERGGQAPPAGDEEADGPLRLQRGEPPGIEELARRPGAWALARLSSDGRRLALARDALGVRGLFWSRSGSRLAFAGSPAALLALPWVSRELDLDHLAEHLSFRYVHAPATLLRAVRSVPAGHLLRVDGATARLERWFDAGFRREAGDAPDPAQAARALDLALAHAVRRRLPAEAEPAVLLSGGLDSSAILFHAAQLRPTVQAFTVSLAEDPSAEAGFAARVATVMGVRHHELRVSSDELIGVVDRASRAMGLPLASPAGLLQLLFFERLGAPGRVVLGGDGGDEVLGGRGLELVHRRMRGPRLVERALPPARGGLRLLARKAGLRDLAAEPDRFGEQRMIGGSRVFKAHERARLLRRADAVRPGVRHAVLDPLYAEVQTDPLNAVLHVWQRGWLAEDSLARSDRLAAAAGLDLRLPMLDADLVRMVNGWPSTLKLQRWGARLQTKAPLRQAMRGRLPDRLLFRPKRSPPAPLDDWLRSGGRAFLVQRLDALCEAEADLFHPEVIRALREEHLDGRANHGLKLWTLVLFQAWRASLG